MLPDATCCQLIYYQNINKVLTLPGCAFGSRLQNRVVIPASGLIIPEPESSVYVGPLTVWVAFSLHCVYIPYLRIYEVCRILLQCPMESWLTGHIWAPKQLYICLNVKAEGMKSKLYQWKLYIFSTCHCCFVCFYLLLSKMNIWKTHLAWQRRSMCVPFNFSQ